MITAGRKRKRADTRSRLSRAFIFAYLSFSPDEPSKPSCPPRVSRTVFFSVRSVGWRAGGAAKIKLHVYVCTQVHTRIHVSTLIILLLRTRIAETCVRGSSVFTSGPEKEPDRRSGSPRFRVPSHRRVSENRITRGGGFRNVLRRYSFPKSLRNSRRPDPSNLH